MGIKPHSTPEERAAKRVEAAYFIGDDGTDSPRYQRYLAEERARAEQDADT